MKPPILNHVPLTVTRGSTSTRPHVLTDMTAPD